MRASTGTLNNLENQQHLIGNLKSLLKNLLFTEIWVVLIGAFKNLRFCKYLLQSCYRFLHIFRSHPSISKKICLFRSVFQGYPILLVTRMCELTQLVQIKTKNSRKSVHKEYHSLLFLKKLLSDNKIPASKRPQKLFNLSNFYRQRIASALP